MNINPYIRLFAGISMISPLVFAFFALDFERWNAFWITFGIYVILFLLATMMLNYLENGNAFIFIPGNKWELFRTNVSMDETIYSPLMFGEEISKRKVIADIYRKKRRNGTYKYKTIPKH